MKQTLFLFLSGLLGALLLTDCSNGSTQQTSANNKADVPEQPVIQPDLMPIDSDFFMLREGQLPCSLNTNIDVSQLNYYHLRLLRAYVYAIHGHWFMEEDLNSFFCNHTGWYEVMCWKTWAYWDWSDTDTTYSAQQRALAMGYNQLLVDDYEKAYKMIELTPEQKEFVSRIDARMNELKKNPLLTNELGESVLNTNLITNLHKFYNPPKGFLQMLQQRNMAFEPSKYEQLFNVYEENEYKCLPHFVTADVFLQAFHMLFSYELKVLESGDIRNMLIGALSELLQGSQESLQCCAEMQLECDRFNLAYWDVALRQLTGDSIHQARLVDNELTTLKPVVDAEMSHIAACEDAVSPLFKTEINFNYSLFKPRGHYTRNERAMQYFRTLMWLQKGCFFREDPLQLEQAMWLANQLNNTPRSFAQLKLINQLLCYLMGDPDNVSIIELAEYMHDHQIKPDVVFDGKQVEQVNNWLVEQFRTRNRVKSTVPNADLMQDQINLLPQRYTLDGEFLSRLYDPKPNAEKAFPNGVEVMDSVRVALTAEHRPAPGSFYTSWLQMLNLLQRPESSVPAPKGLQPFQNTQAWKLKNQNSALASWALLKHDAILYAEQPIGAECGGGDMLPDPIRPNFVEPNVLFWTKLVDIIGRNKQWVERVASGLDKEKLQQRINNLYHLAQTCQFAAQREMKGTYTVEESQKLSRIGSELEYFTLSVLDPESEYLEWSSVTGADKNVAQVADVFTRNVIGCEKCGILYEATGTPNIIYVVYELNGEAFIARGATYSYYEFVRPLGDRLTDEQWQEMLHKGETPAVPEWFAPLLIGDPVDVDQRFIYSSGC